jgi:hypothetical protein
VLQIGHVNPDTGSRAEKEPDPGSGSATTNIIIFLTQKLIKVLGIGMVRDVYSGYRIWIFSSRIPDPRVKSTGSRIRIRNTGERIRTELEQSLKLYVWRWYGTYLELIQ